MGASGSATVVIGFEVHHSDFWEQKAWKDDFVSCPNGHKGGDPGKFCSDCGGKIEYQNDKKWVPTENFRAYCEAMREAGSTWVEPECTWDPNPDCHHDERVSRTDFDGLNLLCADPYQDAERDGDVLVLGVEPKEVEDICSGGRGREQVLGLVELTDTFSQCTRLARKLGLADRPVKLYLCGYCSF